MANLYNLQDKNPIVDSITFADGTKQESATPHLYEHNLIIKSNSKDNFVVFKLLTNTSKKIESMQEIDLILREHGHISEDTCLIASGRYEEDSTQIITAVHFSTEDVDEDWIDSTVCGVFAGNEDEIHVVYVLLNEDNNDHVSSSLYDSAINDTVVKLI